MKTDLKAKLYRKAASKSGKQTGLKFWHNFKKEIDSMMHECSYRTGFDPTKNNIEERKILSDLCNIAIIKLKPTS